MLTLQMRDLVSGMALIAGRTDTHATYNKALCNVKRGDGGRPSC